MTEEQRAARAACRKRVPGSRAPAAPRRARVRPGGDGRAGRSRAPATEPRRPLPRAFEDLARAGFGLATGAAAAGLKLAGRAAGGIGKAVGGR